MKYKDGIQNLMNKAIQTSVIRLQTTGIEAYRRKHNLSAEEIYTVIVKYNLSEFIQDNYELFHISGVNSLVEEIEQYIKEKDKEGE